MFLFPVIFVFSFLYLLKGLLHQQPERLFWFIIIGMSAYTVSMSITYQYGFLSVVKGIKYFKELSILFTFSYLVVKHGKTLKMHYLDWLILILFTYCFCYVFLPIGKFTFIEKVTVFKSYGLFGLLYFIGRLMPISERALKNIIYGILIVTAIAVAVLLVEVLFNRHLQTVTGFAGYNQTVNLLYPSGSYGLSWTFENDIGTKRFASFFNDPLDFAISLLLALCLALSWISYENPSPIKLKWKWLLVALFSFALLKTYSRSSILGFAIVLYAYSILTKRKFILKSFYFSLTLFVFYLAYFTKNVFRNYLIDSISFSENSSLGHLVKWISGIDAMIEHPFGLGLGSSGIYAFGDGQGVGGENQLIFMGVQTGVISMLLYLVIYILIWKLIAQNLKNCEGVFKIIAFAMLLMRIGFLIPMMTSYFESFLYINYLTWILSGVLITHFLSGTPKASVLENPKGQ